ncbi:hypothetical protein PHLGIDRAFT_412290 [Phlebiopsis gigantea 11061_1 CR5-6]|uniref:Phosphatidylinositol-specific phospholipase C X domain-containing protein n=1 Tax=Phlebiopsis gigantea (strain 11061_1 CR5-6) TaxID=745531 RepID=A0A0C3NR56_PHLG1|nr:hypothetical protein PHLGIDRAFT_412290 [Phlebiopsis gigantea 11061_1 CR5-6]
MGVDGDLVIVNGTPYDWVKTKSHSYQMDTWDFPDLIPPGQVAVVHVEFKEGIFTDESDDGGEVGYSLRGTSNTFQLLARAPKQHYNLQVFFDGISTANNPQGTSINLGWKEDGDVVFILSGSEGFFSSTNPHPDWMQRNLTTLGDRPLRHLCIPGSHDSGMSKVDGKTALANEHNVITQTVSIGVQLALGARYFDARPVIADGAFKTGHYSDVEVLGWQGANGQSFSEIVDEINAFTVENKELIVLNLSHDRNTDESRDFQALSQVEWDRLFEQLTAINYLYVAPDPTAVDLTTLTLNDFIGNGEAAVLIIVQPDAPETALGDYANRGFYFYRQFDAYNVYSNSDKLEVMVPDQIDKMRAVRPNRDGQLFLLSWTLTQHPKEIVTDGRILDLAEKANPTIFRLLVPACDTATFPNILYIDDFSKSDVTALAIAINHIASS